MTDEEPPDLDLTGDYIENTEEYERALSAMLTPNGRRISEIAGSEHTAVDEDVLRRVAESFVQDSLILLESDGEPDDPRLYRNPVMGFFQQVWRQYAAYGGVEGLEDRISELEAEYAAYQEQTEFDDPEALREAIPDSGVDLSQYQDGETGEVFWDVYQPWAHTAHQLTTAEAALELAEYMDESLRWLDMDVSGAYGDFSNINAIQAKLGLENQPSGAATMSEDGSLEYPDGSEDAVEYERED